MMRLVTIIAAVIFGLDQVSKYVVVHLLELDRIHMIYLLDPYLNFRMAWNEGVNFGLLANSAQTMRWALTAVAVVIAVWVWFWVRRERPRKLMQVAAGLLIGGALGNAADRIIYGAVADFLNMSLPGWQNPYSFNIADVAIFAGAIGLVLFTGRAKTP